MEPFELIIYAIILIAIIIFIAKKAIGIAVCLAAILFLFSVGFRYGGAEIKQYAQYFKPEAETAIVAFFDDFESKREQFALIDTEKVYDGMKEGIEVGKNIVIEGIGQLDINAFAKDLASTIYDAGLKDIDFDALVKEIKDSLGITKDEAITVATEVITELNKNK